MKKLQPPMITLIESYHACVNGVSDAGLKTKYKANQNNVAVKCYDYFFNAESGTLYTLPQTVHPRGTDPIVSGTTLLKSELKSLYSDYMVPSRMSARTLVYDEIIVAANGRCPFCGGVGQVRNLDHYLPKARYPEFSVLPGNLVPSCMDCNMGEKGVGVAANAGEQVLHPYFDAAHFFQEQWVVGTLTNGEAVGCSYSVAAPTHWSPTDQQRVNSHFLDFGLKHRFEIQASAEISWIINSRKKTLKQLTSADFKNHLLDGAIDADLPVNHWRRVLYQAMAESDWFCEYVF